MAARTRKLFHIDGKPVWLNADEEAALRPQAKQRTPGIVSGYSEGKSGTSLSMSCHPAQAELMNSTIKAHGISGIEWDKRGKCKITSRRGRKRAMPVVGQMLRIPDLHDCDAGYGD